MSEPANDPPFLSPRDAAGRYRRRTVKETHDWWKAGLGDAELRNYDTARVDAPPKSPLWGGEHHHAPCAPRDAASQDDVDAELEANLWWVYGA